MTGHETPVSAKSENGRRHDPSRPKNLPNNALADFLGFWNRLAVWVRVVIALVVLVIVINVIYFLQKSPYEDQCKAEATREGFHGSDFTTVVNFCIDSGEKYGHT